MTTISGVGNLFDASAATQGSSATSASWLRLLPPEYGFLLLLLTHTTGCTSCVMWPPEEPDARLDAGDADGDVDSDTDIDSDTDVDVDVDAEIDREIERDVDLDVEIDESVDADLEIVPLCPTMTRLGSEARISDEGSFAGVLSLVWTDSGYGVAWEDLRHGPTRNIYFNHFSSEGAAAGSDIHITALEGGVRMMSHVSLAWTGSEYGVVWNDVWGSGQERIFFNRISGSGDLGASERVVVDSPGNVWWPLLVWSGSNYGLTWTDTRDGNSETYFGRLASDGTLREEELPITTNDGFDSAAASLVWTGSEYGVAWVDERDGNQEIYFERISASGDLIGPEIRVTYAERESNSPRMVWGDHEYGLVWSDARDGMPEIYFRRVAEDGALMGEERRLTHGTEYGYGWMPSLAWTGSEYGITWVDFIEPVMSVYFQRMSHTGDLIDSAICLSTSTGAVLAPVVWTGSEYGVAWQQRDMETWASWIYFARIGCEE